MAIFLSGADNPAHLRILMNAGADRVAVNVAGLARRATRSWTLDLPGEWEWVAYADGAVTGDQIRYALDNSAKPPIYIVGGDTLAEFEGYVPLWNGEGELPKNRELGLCITDRVFKDGKLARRALSTRLQGGCMGALTGSIDPDIARYDFVISGSWWSVLKYGETQIWDGRAMHRFNADNQQKARTQYREAIEELGLSFDLVLAGDVDESAQMAIESWKAYGRSFAATRPAVVTPFPIVTIEDDPEAIQTGLVPQSLAIAPPLERHERRMLPVIGMTTAVAKTYDDDGQPHQPQTLVHASGEAVRRCDNCTLANSGCPGYEPASLCAYNIPIEIRTKDQLGSVMQAVLEMQTQRVFQARFFEEVTGQELGPDVGLEADRLFRLIEKMGAVLDNRDSIKMTVEAHATGGMLSRLFGDKAGQAARQLTHPLDSNRVIDTITSPD